MEEKKSNRKWVVKAMIGFVAVLALLTFFSNTIMNATIPKVIGAYPSRGNLSYTNNATSTVEATNVVKVKGIDGRVVDTVSNQNYWYVYAGDVIVTLQTVTDTTQYDTLVEQYNQLVRQREYDQRQPNDPTDYTSLREGITQAEEALAEAQATLVAAQNKNTTISNANTIINNNQASAVALEAEVSAASATLEDLNAQIAAIDARVEQIDSQVAIYTALGTPTPTPIVAGEESNEPVVTPEITESEEPTAEPTPSAGDRTMIDSLFEELYDLAEQKELLESQIASAEERLSSKSAELSAVNAVIEEAQAQIAEAEMLPTVTSAQSAVNLAQSALTQARRSLTNTQIQDGIAADQAQDAAEATDRQIEDLEEQIAEMEENMEVTELVAPIDGILYNVNVGSGDMLTSDSVVFEIIPDDTEYTVTFSFASSVAQTMYVGMELSIDMYGADSCRINRIVPDPANPRETMKVICDLPENVYFYPGESITATADRANQNYDHVVPSSAINEDNSGTFVFIIEQSSTPLGDKYVVRRVDVSVEANDGSMSAISGNGLDNGMVVTRSEQPLNDGDRVRLEDYSNTNR